MWNYFQAHKKLSYNLGLFPFKSVLAISLFCSVFNSSSVLVCLLLLASFSYLRFNNTWQIPAQEYKVKKPLWFDRYSVMCNQKKKRRCTLCRVLLRFVFCTPIQSVFTESRIWLKETQKDRTLQTHVSYWAIQIIQDFSCGQCTEIDQEHKEDGLPTEKLSGIRHCVKEMIFPQNTQNGSCQV